MSEPKERPIIMTAESVRAILAGAKTQTRRVLSPHPTHDRRGLRWPRNRGDDCFTWTWDPPGKADIALFKEKLLGHCPYGVPGDRLWVRETWGAVWPGEDPVPLEECRIEYRADLSPGCTDYPGGWDAETARDCEDAPRWRSPRFMPRWASRITLEVVNIRVERVQEISFDDAIAEGVCEYPPDAHGMRSECRRWFEELWDEINAKRGYGWNVNPWVWAVEFKMVES